jgi:hypothetical protein
MGAKMMRDELAFASFEPFGQGFRAYLAIEKALDGGEIAGELAQRAANIYEKSIKDMTSTIRTINAWRASNKPVSARLIWKLGDTIFSLRHNLMVLGLQLDGVYDHLTRDLNVKTKWLEKVIILRRNLTKEELIPESLNWGRLEKGTSRKSRLLATGKSIE